jgi:hypothetical protein
MAEAHALGEKIHDAIPNEYPPRMLLGVLFGEIAAVVTSGDELTLRIKAEYVHDFIATLLKIMAEAATVPDVLKDTE